MARHGGDPWDQTEDAATSPRCAVAASARPGSAGRPRAHQAPVGIDRDVAESALDRHGARVSAPSSARSLIFRETPLFPWLSVWENVALRLTFRSASPAQRRRVAREAQREVGLTAAMEKRPDGLPGDMRRHVAVARALAMRPQAPLMDEPFATLNMSTRARMQDFPQDVRRESASSALFATRHVDEAVALSNRGVMFTARPGRVETILDNPPPRPRDPFSPESERRRRRLTALLRDAADRAVAEQKALGA